MGKPAHQRKLLRIQYPIIQAPMAGGGDTPRLVAAVSEAGALGSIGAAYLTPQQIAESARAVRSLSSRPFGINLFAPTRSPEGPLDARRAVARPLGRPRRREQVDAERPG